MEVPSAESFNTKISVLPPPPNLFLCGKLADVVLPRITGLPPGSTYILCGNSSLFPPTYVEKILALPSELNLVSPISTPLIPR